jgi:hypothetical protein
MDPQKIKDVYERLEQLDDRLGHRLRARQGPGRLTLEQLEDRVKDIAAFSSELRDLVRDLVLAFATPRAAPRE